MGNIMLISWVQRRLRQGIGTVWNGGKLTCTYWRCIPTMQACFQPSSLSEIRCSVTETDCDIPLSRFLHAFDFERCQFSPYILPTLVYYPRFQRGGHRRKTDSEEPNTLQIVIGPCGGDSEHELSTMAVSGLSSDRSMSQEMFFNFPVPVVL